MNRWIRVAAAGLVLVFAACGDGSSGSPLAPDAARFDSTPITGGNKAAQDTTFFATTASDTTDAYRSTPITGGN